MRRAVTEGADGTCVTCEKARARHAAADGAARELAVRARTLARGRKRPAPGRPAASATGVTGGIGTAVAAVAVNAGVGASARRREPAWWWFRRGRRDAGRAIPSWSPSRPFGVAFGTFLTLWPRAPRATRRAPRVGVPPLKLSSGAAIRGSRGSRGISVVDLVPAPRDGALHSGQHDPELRARAVG
jgi:hypothetical protein